MCNRKRKGLLLISLALMFVMAFAMTAFGAEEEAEYVPAVYSTFWALVPPIVAIGLALLTKEVYSSLFVGILMGGILYSGLNFEMTIVHIFEDGIIGVLSDSYNVGILVFLVILGAMVSLMNKAGGSAAFGQFAAGKIHSRVGAQLATVLLGVLIFIDDYFNCLTVGSVMRPVTDRHQVSRAKLAYLIDATAAPVCIIAPISSWAAAVTSSVPEDSGINGFTMFLRTIPYNYYAILTLVMIIYITVCKMDFGPMRIHEKNALNGDLFTTEARPYGGLDDEIVSPRGKVIDLIFPVAVLIFCCVIGMIYTGGFFDGEDFVTAFANSDASMGLVLGSSCTLLITFLFYMLRNVMTFKDFTDCIPEGFKAMVAPILILTMAWTLSGMTGLLGAKFFVADLVSGSASGLQGVFPAIIFIVAAGLAFSTGTSWGTFGILIPIVCSVFPSGEMLAISISSCLAGSVCGDHCSPISDTTIMASAGAHSDHVNHVSTQLPYALTAAAVSMVCYILSGFLGQLSDTLPVALICLPLAIILMVATLTGIRIITGKDKP